MKKYYYDLHVHSCLSPCGDDDNTPNNIVGMAKLCELDIVALTDHNSCKNCPAFFDAAKKYGITPIAGMELTTAEDIHAVCLFENLEDALAFDKYVDEGRMKLQNKPHIFGRQCVLDSEDELLYEEEYLLINASSISISDVKKIVESFGGVCYPAHIDKESCGIISVLGDLPNDIPFDYYEIHNPDNIQEYSSRYNIPKERFIVSSDAHYLTDLRDKENCFEFDALSSDELIREELFRILRKRLT